MKNWLALLLSLICVAAQADTLKPAQTIILPGTITANLCAPGVCIGGGRGTPGGANGSLQYNNAGAFGGYTVGTGLQVSAGALNVFGVPDTNITVTGDQFGCTTQDCFNAAAQSAVATPVGSVNQVTITPVAGTPPQYVFSLADVHGNVYLSKSSTNLALCPFNGNLLFIGGANYLVPAACVTLSPSGLSASTFYRIYAYMSGTTMTLEASTTAHATDTTYGNEEKSGDSTRAFVGVAYTSSGTAWVDLPATRWVASYFNPQRKRAYGQFTSSNKTLAAATATYPNFIEVDTSIETSFVVTGGPAALPSGAASLFPEWRINGSVGDGTLNDGCLNSVGYDGAFATATSTGVPVEVGGGTTTAATATNAAASGMTTTLSEGVHIGTLIGSVLTGGTCTWYYLFDSAEWTLWQ